MPKVRTIRWILVKSIVASESSADFIGVIEFILIRRGPEPELLVVDPLRNIDCERKVMEERMHLICET